MRLSVVFAWLLVLAPSTALGIDMWHSSTVWVGQGQCSAQFTFDSGMKEVRNLQVMVSAVDNKSGKKVASGTLQIREFGTSNANRYETAFLEGEAVCSDQLTIVVNKATAVVEGKRVDLLQNRGLTVRDFRAFRIRIGK